VNAGLIYIYFTNFQSVDEEEYGGAWELTKEGFMTSFAGFLVRKILSGKYMESYQIYYFTLILVRHFFHCLYMDLIYLWILKCVSSFCLQISYDVINISIDY
jgi:hypothetical protein